MGNKNSPEDVGLLSGEKKGEIGGMCSHTEGKIRGAERTGGKNLRGFFFLEKGDMKNTQYITLATGGFNLE